VTAVAITGLGAVSSCGIGIDALWAGLLGARSFVGPIGRFDHRKHRTHQAAEVPLENWPTITVPVPHSSSQCDRFALWACDEALKMSGLSHFGQSTVGVAFGSSTGGMLEAERWYASGLQDRKRYSRIGALASQQTNAPGDLVARAFAANGPVVTLSSACASATLALCVALDLLRSGEADVMLAGGADSLCQLTFAGFNALRSVDPHSTRPFRLDRAGLSIGEGGAVLVLERLEHAEARGARPLALLSGAGASCDAHHMTAPEPSGAGAARAIRAALQDAQLPAAAIDFVNAHATGTPHNDAAEWNAMVEVFGDRAANLPITATKATLGHFLGSAGAIEAVATVLTLRNRVLHPAPGGGELDPACPALLIRDVPRSAPWLRHAISTNLAFGGSNAAVVISSFESDP
jgi:3-oxoacyl-[acyl-carrier-protein] synthase II